MDEATWWHRQPQHTLILEYDLQSTDISVAMSSALAELQAHPALDVWGTCASLFHTEFKSCNHSCDHSDIQPLDCLLASHQPCWLRGQSDSLLSVFGRQSILPSTLCMQQSGM